MKTKITIKKVELHDGNVFKGTNWKNPMQVIYTEKGLFIDNIKEKCFGHSNIKWKGIDWKQYIGQTVEILIVNCVGKEVTSLSFEPTNTIEILTSNLGNHYKNCSNHNWAYPLFLLGEPYQYNKGTSKNRFHLTPKSEFKSFIFSVNY